jgi:hypothetical protein
MDTTIMPLIELDMVENQVSAKIAECVRSVCFYMQVREPVQREIFRECGPQLGCLVDADFARLLGIRLTELLACVQALQATLKNAAFAGEVGCVV